MTINAAALNLIKGFESKELKAYRDAVGVWTIGYGHTAMAGPPSPKAGMTITSAEADALLLKDLGKYEAPVKKLVKVPLNENQYGALTSLVFNIGEGNFAKSTLLKKLNAGNYAAVPAELMKWNKAKGKVLAGLTRRRKAEGQLFTKPASKPLHLVPQAPVKVTPLPVAPIADEPVKLEPVAAPAQATNKEIIMTVQKRLRDLGYNPGGADGILGPLTRGSILSFKNDNKMKPVDTIDDELLTALATAKPREMVPARANATLGEVAAKIPEARVHWWTRLSAGLLGGSVGGVGLLDQITPAVGYLTPVKEFVGEVPPLVWIGGIVLVCVALYFGSQYGATKAKEAFNAGDRR